MRLITDMLGREIPVPDTPKRIVSLVPSQTELLADLGLEEEVVGITKFCVHPERWFRSKSRIGGTKNISIERIRALRPDLILANREENVQEQTEILASEFPVWVSDISNLAEACSMISRVGELTRREQEAAAILEEIQSGFNALQSGKEISCAYLIWYGPWMSIGRDTFIHDLLARAGFRNVLSHKYRYPETSLQELAALKPELVLLSSEPFPFKEKHAAELKAAIPDACILFADGELCSWYGSRMRYAPAYLAQLKALC